MRTLICHTPGSAGERPEYKTVPGSTPNITVVGIGEMEGGSVPPGEPSLADAAILFMDGKRHRSYRRLVQPSFVPSRAVWWLNKWTSDVATSLIDSFAGETRADLNTDFCAPIPPQETGANPNFPAP